MGEMGCLGGEIKYLWEGADRELTQRELGGEAVNSLLLRLVISLVISHLISPLLSLVISLLLSLLISLLLRLLISLLISLLLSLGIHSMMAARNSTQRREQQALAVVPCLLF